MLLSAVIIHVVCQYFFTRQYRVVYFCDDFFQVVRLALIEAFGRNGNGFMHRTRKDIEIRAKLL